MAAFVWDADPEIFRIGSFALRWYSLMFAGGFIASHWLLQSMWRHENRDPKEIDQGLVWVIIATIVGARLAHCLFYDPGYYLANPLEILKVWTGGLASHGGFAAVFVTLWVFALRFRTISFLGLMDRALVPTALVAGLIRIGNLFNSEIIGRPTDGPFGVVFKRVDDLARHPGQLYEAIGYLAVASALSLLYWRTAAKSHIGTLTGFALVTVGTVRFAVEFVKENQAAFEEGMVLNMGQLLTLPFVALGIALLFGVQNRFDWLVKTVAERDVGVATPESLQRRGLRKGRKKKGAA